MKINFLGKSLQTWKTKGNEAPKQVRWWGTDVNAKLQLEDGSQVDIKLEAYQGAKFGQRRVYFYWKGINWHVLDNNLHTSVICQEEGLVLTIAADHRHINRKHKFSPDLVAKFNRNDAGARASVVGAGENNDCTVVATAVSLGVSYDEAHAIMKNEVGRKEKQGATLSFHLCVNRTLGGRQFEPVCVTSRADAKTLGQFIKKFTDGTYLVFTKGHVSTLVDGKLHDRFFAPKCRVYSAYKLVEEVK